MTWRGAFAFVRAAPRRIDEGFFAALGEAFRAGVERRAGRRLRPRFVGRAVWRLPAKAETETRS